LGTEASRALRIGVLEDQPLYREMLQHLLLAFRGAKVVTAADCNTALSSWDARNLDVALLDVELPDGNGIDVGRELRSRNPDLGIVLLSAVDRSRALLELDDAERARWSYLSKRSSTSAAVLIRAIRASAEGRSMLDPEVIAKSRVRAGGQLEALSSRQFEVLELLAEGLSNQAIAERLGLALNSANNHVNAIYATLGIERGEINPRVVAVRLFLEETL